ncbi:MAG: hypothetical protein M1820_000340 [Bogoriella megaspora]|nr:MAG: hypothetical protein M1820_000340 [Bogoriella megaspora]
MPSIAEPSRTLCTRCLRVRYRRQPNFSPNAARTFRATPISVGAQSRKDGSESAKTHPTHGEEKKEQGAMSRRLEDLSETSLETGGRSAAKAIEEAGFDEDLKRRLENRIADAQFREQHRSALAQAEMPSSADQRSRDIAGAKPWQGEESVEDAALRMLTDSHKPLRVPTRTPSSRGPPRQIDTGRPKSKPSSGARLANARDKTSMYAYLKDQQLSEKEREQVRKELKDRFAPAARAVPATIQGLASLANERIEDAIARGQFKNLPRGQKIERDYNASSPFLNTTEYFMNKIIQKQEIVPPWIEKQQELVAMATRFRGRLRNDWKRHASRLIASRGGSLQEQIRRAEGYAAAEAALNPSKKRVEKLNAVADDGRVSQITLAGELKITSDQGMSATESEITVSEKPLDEVAASEEPPSNAQTRDQSPESIAPDIPTPDLSPRPNVSPTLFRDPAWEKIEHSFHTLSITELNNLTRSYNLMAPNLAKKPYFSLDRELRNCYADVAPLLPQELRDRAANPMKGKVEIIGHKPGGVLEKFTGGEKTRVWDERRPQYGFKEFWRDLWGKGTV